jgi:hypothetical protein
MRMLVYTLMNNPNMQIIMMTSLPENSDNQKNSTKNQSPKSKTLILK